VVLDATVVIQLPMPGQWVINYLAIGLIGKAIIP